MPVKLILTKGYFTTVDDEDAELVCRFKWCASFTKTGYIYAVRKRRLSEDGPLIIKLHRFLMNPPAGQVVDHINGDTLYNVRSNLRNITQSLNIVNQVRKAKPRFGYRGVGISGGRYFGIVRVHHKTHNTSTFPTPEQAARARDALAMELQGTFAVLNFPPPGNA